MRRKLLLGLSLYWRLLVVSLILATVIVVSILSTPLMEDITYIRLKPTVLFSLFGLVWLASLLALPNGIVYLVWGKRLNLPTQFWRKFTVALAVLFFALALANLLAIYLLSVQSWLQYKLYVPSAAILAAPFIAAAIFSRAPETAANGPARSKEA